MHSENLSDFPIERRRASDQPTNAELYKAINEIKGIVSDLARSQDATMTAFTTNDLGKPDLDGHRKAHLGMIRAAQVMDNYKTEAVKKVLGIVVAFVVGLTVTGGIDKLREIVAGKPAAVAVK